jgi:hypothetical protein
VCFSLEAARSAGLQREAKSAWLIGAKALQTDLKKQF